MGLALWAGRVIVTGRDLMPETWWEEAPDLMGLVQKPLVHREDHC